MEENAQETLQALISTKLDSVITSIDGEEFGGKEQDLVIKEDPLVGLRGGGDSAGREVARGANRAISTAVISTNYFAKVHLYANSKLPPNLPPLQLYLPTYPLLCLAANYSQRAYTKPTGEEREAFVNADWRMGTKAMVIKSVPIDDMNCVVFAIRGSQTFMDWAVNLNSAPVSPTDFLDDAGFKRIHCITFGTPPISLLPLNKPATHRYKKSLFMSFINEGDPVPRADKAYVRSLLSLYASPAPGTKCIASVPALKSCKRPKAKRANSAPAAPTKATTWKVPPGELSNAGRLVVLREPRNAGAEAQDDVKAEITSDQELRTVVFGDPVMHMMKVYARRIEVLATKAVTARIWA
ncbi:hypothetical protein OEA41_008367 [Lepraria neglecta]|uniref:Uncharacterized protein n=1 Tax=Lepraria neglecta TaxID=209136 RepID=A0AAE0DNT0_9LECA|nr:hypothetical protein OEA41_008367 [Lepraria neglecta]